jgi:hypothetical protein
LAVLAGSFSTAGVGSLQPVVFVASLQSVPVGRMAAALVLLFKNGRRGGSAEEINDRTIICKFLKDLSPIDPESI